MSRLEVDGLRQISVTLLKVNGFFSSGWITGTINWEGGRSGAKGSAEVTVSTVGSNKYVHIRYTSDGGTIDCEMPLVTTACGSGGGVRYWFICPVRGCERRVGVLYLGSNGFACRHCYNLTYASRNETKRVRDMFKFDYDAIEKQVRREMAL